MNAKYVNRGLVVQYQVLYIRYLVIKDVGLRQQTHIITRISAKAKKDESYA